MMTRDDLRMIADQADRVSRQFAGQAQDEHLPASRNTKYEIAYAFAQFANALRESAENTGP